MHYGKQELSSLGSKEVTGRPHLIQVHVRLRQTGSLSLIISNILHLFTSVCTL